MNDPVGDKVVQICGDILGVDGLNGGSSFYEHGGTSIMAEQIATRIEGALSVRLSGIEVMRDHCLEDLIRTVKRKIEFNESSGPA